MSRIVLRLLSAGPALFGALVLTFLLTRVLPGDPAVFFASNPSMTEADVAAVRSALGLDRPLPEQFWIYLRGLAGGDLGQSVMTGRSVAAEISARLPASAELTLMAFAMALAVALPLGAAAALRPGTPVDHLARLLAALAGAMPTFVTGLLLVFLFYVVLDWAPEPIGRLGPFSFEPPRITGFLTLDAVLAGDLPLAREALGRLVLPATTMALFALAPLTRVMRTAMLGVMASPFIRGAKAAGLSRRRILQSYALRNAMLPVVTMMGMTVSYMLGASVLVEKVFSWPGIGSLAVDSIVNLDHAPLQGIMLVMAGIFILVNLLTDIILALIDPRAGA